MGSLYLSSIMKVQTIIFVLVVCAGYMSAKNVPFSEVEIQKSEADEVLNRSKRGFRDKVKGWFNREEKESRNNDYDDTTDDYVDTTDGYTTNGYTTASSNNNRKNNNKQNNYNRGNGRDRPVDWVQLVLGIVQAFRGAG